MLLTQERTPTVVTTQKESTAPKSVAGTSPTNGSGPRGIIRRYILDNFLFSDDPSAIRDDASLLKLGIMDSVGALEIALFLEEKLGITVRQEEMLPENLDSVDNLVAFVERRKKLS